MKAKPLNISGFTLIELLVVIAIIALIAAILFPVFASAREKARQSTCLSNIKEIGLAEACYLQDDDGAYPYIRYITSAGWLTWADFIQPYMKTYKILACPDHVGTSSAVSAGDTWATSETHYEVTYSVNNLYDSCPTDSSIGCIWTGTTPESHIADPADCVFIGDFGYNPGESSEPDEFEAFPHTNTLEPETTSNGLPGICSTRSCWVGYHSGGINVGFLDGHAKWMNMSTLTQRGANSDWKWFVTNGQ